MVHGTNMGPIWGRQDPGGPHVIRMNFAIWDAAHKLNAYQTHNSLGLNSMNTTGNKHFIYKLNIINALKSVNSVQQLNASNDGN